MAAVEPLANLIPDVLMRITHTHQQHVVNQVGPVTLAEVDARMPEAARLHAREWDRTPHPADATLDPRVHDWATRHIALNLVARDRGCVIGSGWERTVYARPVRQPLPLVPASRTGED